MVMAWMHLEKLTALVDDKLVGVPPWKIALVTFGSTLAGSYVYGQLTHKVPFSKRARSAFFRLVRRLPAVHGKVAQEKAKARRTFEAEFRSTSAQLADFTELPHEGWDREKVIDKTKDYLGLGEFDWTKGTQSGTVYNGNPALTSLMTEVYGLAAWTNPLHPDTFPGVRKMEAEVVRMCCQLFRGGPDSCGSITTGGTESIILACKAYRDYARNVKGIEHPVMLAPKTAHAAFDKAADLLDIGLEHVPVDRRTQKVDVNAMRKRITSRTCLLVGSAPQFPHGSIDDIAAIAELGRTYNIPVHVDSCLGGFLTAFMADAGYPIPPCDFSVPGVTSISADTHKYGFAPKGSSVVLYANEELRHHQFFTVVDWPGGLYATAVMGGSRAGAIIAACWASLMYYGRSGYVDCTRKIVEVTRKIAKGLENIEGLKIIGVPEVSVVAIESDRFNIYSLSDQMKKRGWNLSALQFPPSIHLACTMVHTQDGVAERLISDVAEVTKMILEDPEKYMGGSVAVYGMAQSLPDRGIVDELTKMYLDAFYCTSDRTDSAEVNDIQR